jgi:hypothetical protein
MLDDVIESNNMSALPALPCLVLSGECLHCVASGNE